MIMPRSNPSIMSHPMHTLRIVSWFIGLYTGCGLLAANEGAIEYRQSVYKAIGGHMSSMVSILRGQVPHEDHLRGHAHALHALSQMAPTLFPEDSGEGKTKALPAIWSRKDEFRRNLQNFQEAARGVADVADNGDLNEFARAFQRLGRQCKNCHDNFKAE